MVMISIVPLYNLDLLRATIYIKRVLRPVCLVALSLAAISFAAGQVPVPPTPSVTPSPFQSLALPTPPGSKPAASKPPSSTSTSKSTPATSSKTTPAKEEIVPEAPALRPVVPAPSTSAATTTTAPTTPTSSAPNSTTTTTTTTTANANQAPATNPPPSIPGMTPLPDKTVTLQFPNSDVVDVLRYYEQITGKKLIMDNFVQGKVNIALSRAVPRDEAIKIIEMNLLMNGYSLVPAGDDIVKVIGTGRSPRNAGIPLISDEADIPEGEHVISFLFKLRFADPVELQQVLGQYLSPPQAYTSFLALPKAGSILITENSSVIRTLIRIVDQIDVPPAQVVSEFIKLERADATKVVEMLKEVFEKGSTTTTTTTVAPGVRPVRPPNAPQPPPQVTNQVSVEGDLSAFTALSEDSIVVGKIKIAADVRTNRIHVITRPVNMPFIKKLISEFDANVEFAKPVTRALRYISAAEVLPVIVQALTEPGANQAGGGGDNSNPAAAQQQANQNQRRTTPPSSTGGGFDSGGSSGGGQSFSEELSTQAVDTTPRAVTIGNAKIIADQRSNSIIVLGNKEVVVKVGKILDEMDVKAPQVALATVIGELTLSKNEEFGVDWFQNYRATGSEGHTDVNGRNFRTPDDTGAALAARNGIAGITPLDPRTLTDITKLAGAAATNGTSVFLSTGFGLAAMVKALDSTGKFKVISRPMVFTSNNKKAIIASGQEIPVPVSTLSSFVPTTSGSPGTGTVQNFGSQSSIQYKKVALQLEVVPLINSENEVTLDILQKLDNIADTTRIDGNDIPNVATRYIKTTVSAPNCSTIVLGGLITDNDRRNVSGIPILSKIPIIGSVFRSTTKVKDRRELIVLMRPEVALTKLDLHRLRQKHEEKSHFGPEIDHDDCPDCPKTDSFEDKQIVLPQPDMPGMK
jgi:general secretion pathway protein D